MFTRVAPHAGAWIETLWKLYVRRYFNVAPHAGAWIGNILEWGLYFSSVSVAPHAGAWIETVFPRPDCSALCVAPHAGAWIETRSRPSISTDPQRSRPMRARGLKHEYPEG